MTTEEFKTLTEENGFTHGIYSTYHVDIDNPSNCQMRIYLQLLNDNKTVRVSVGKEDDMDGIFDSVDLFETQSYQRINNFLNYLF